MSTMLWPREPKTPKTSGVKGGPSRRFIVGLAVVVLTTLAVWAIVLLATRQWVALSNPTPDIVTIQPPTPETPVANTNGASADEEDRLAAIVIKANAEQAARDELKRDLPAVIDAQAKRMEERLRIDEMKPEEERRPAAMNAERIKKFRKKGEMLQ